jgi:hypothetical protein
MIERAIQYRARHPEFRKEQNQITKYKRALGVSAAEARTIIKGLD